jgi:hypothetical protein
MTVFLTPVQVVDGDLKMILGLMWRLILATQVAAITQVEFIIGGDERQIDGGAKSSLLEWVRKRIEPYPKVKVFFFFCNFFMTFALLKQGASE